MWTRRHFVLARQEVGRVFDKAEIAKAESKNDHPPNTRDWVW